MPRTARASVGGICYHVLNRGNGGAEVFRKNEDYAAFLKLLDEAGERGHAAGGLLPDAQPLSSGALAAGGRRPEPLHAVALTSHVRRYHRHYRRAATLAGAFQGLPHPGQRAPAHGAALCGTQSAAGRRPGRAQGGTLALVVGRHAPGDVERPRLHAGPVPRGGLAGLGEPAADGGGVGGGAGVCGAGQALRHGALAEENGRGVGSGVG